MPLTVLGGAGVFPSAGGACSGYLVEHDGYRVLRPTEIAVPDLAIDLG